MPNKLTDWGNAFREENTDLIKDREMVKNLLTRQEAWVQSLVWEDPLEKRMATYSSILA